MYVRTSRLRGEVIWITGFWAAVYYGEQDFIDPIKPQEIVECNLKRFAKSSKL